MLRQSGGMQFPLKHLAAPLCGSQCPPAKIFRREIGDRQPQSTCQHRNQDIIQIHGGILPRTTRSVKFAQSPGRPVSGAMSILRSVAYSAARNFATCAAVSCDPFAP